MIVEKIKKFLKANPNQRLLTVAVLVAGLTCLTKLVSMIKELVVAFYFGTGSAMDAFVIAFVVPSFIINLIISSIQAAIIPTYIQVQAKEGFEASQQFLSGITLSAFFLLILISILLGLGAKFFFPWIASGFDPDKLHLVCLLFYIMLPMLILNGLSSLWTGIINSKGYFSIPALVPIVTPILTIILLKLLSNYTININTLAVSMTLGAFLELLFLGLALNNYKLTVWPNWFGMSPAFKQAIKQLVPTLIGALILGASPLIDQSMATFLPGSSNSVMNYAIKLIAVPLTLAVTALSTAVTPLSSKMAASKNWQGLKDLSKYYLKLIFICSLIFMAIIASVCNPLVKALFERGAFTAEDSRIVAEIFKCFLLQVPFYIGSTLLSRLLSAINQNQILMTCTFLLVTANCLLNYLFMHWIGVAGIALSTSVVYGIAFIYLLCMFNSKINFKISENSSIMVNQHSAFLEK